MPEVLSSLFLLNCEERASVAFQRETLKHESQNTAFPWAVLLHEMKVQLDIGFDWLLQRAETSRQIAYQPALSMDTSIVFVEVV